MLVISTGEQHGEQCWNVFQQSCAAQRACTLELYVLRQELLDTDVQVKPTGRFLQAAIWPVSLIWKTWICAWKHLTFQMVNYWWWKMVITWLSLVIFNLLHYFYEVGILLSNPQPTKGEVTTLILPQNSSYQGTKHQSFKIVKAWDHKGKTGPSLFPDTYFVISAPNCYTLELEDRMLQ